MKTHCVRADSSQALTSDIRSFVFLTDSFESQGSHNAYLLCILSVYAVNAPRCFCLMRICEGNFRTEEQKNGSPESFWMRLSEEGDREF